MPKGKLCDSARPVRRQRLALRAALRAFRSLVRLRRRRLPLRVTKRAACAVFHEDVGAGDEAHAVAVFAAQFGREREAVDDVFVGAVDFLELILRFADLLIQPRDLRILFFDVATALLQLFEARETEIEKAADERDDDHERDQFRAQVDLAYEFARKLAEENFGVVARVVAADSMAAFR